MPIHKKQVKNKLVADFGDIRATLVVVYHLQGEDPKGYPENETSCNPAFTVHLIRDL
jgi:hypothetical protein